MTSMDMRFEPSGPRAQRLIALELNELCPALLSRWMGEGLLPNFARLHAESDVFVTQADVEDSALLEPWIQWYSIHTGLPYAEHRVFHLTDGARAGHADIYRMLIKAGRRIMSFASMNVAPFSHPGSVFVGDPWSENGDAWPRKLNVYNRFVSRNVREYSNASDRMGLADQAKFLGFMVANGLRTSTVAQILAQLGTEKMQDPRLAWRRVAVLDRLQFDVFRSYYKRSRPHFASFFANSVAHLQHSYWRHMEPDVFLLKPELEEMEIYRDAIFFGYRAMDELIGDFVALARAEGATLLFATALSQQPFLRHEELGGQHFHRLHDVSAFLARLGIECREVDPTMTHQYRARFASPREAEEARTRLEALRLEDGRMVFGFPAVETDESALYFGCQTSTKTPTDTPVIDGRSNASIPFGELFYQIEAIKSGRHHPDGCLWIQSGRHAVHEHKPSILDILPTQLEMLGVPVPAECRGASLLPQMAA